jgi:hypothetical protein
MSIFKRDTFAQTASPETDLANEVHRTHKVEQSTSKEWLAARDEYDAAKEKAERAGLVVVEDGYNGPVYVLTKAQLKAQGGRRK